MQVSTELRAVLEKLLDFNIWETTQWIIFNLKQIPDYKV